jgi:protein-S-isoprenylcysteine O-methyltransferase Ste14
MDTGMHPEPSAAALIQEALEEARTVVQLEARLAVDDVRKQVLGFKQAGISFGVAAVAALLGVAMLLVALALAISLSAIPALIIGLVLVVVAAVVGYAGWRKMPRKPLDVTQQRIKTDVRIVKESLA